jgi:catechol 2,3-dioxygenase-like lactoylglutathione lyase family enzyme
VADQLGADDDRPTVWAGHISVPVRDVPAAAEFYERIGMRVVAATDDVAVLELRGGTHLVAYRDPDAGPAVDPDSASRAAGFDLMVDDLEATHTEWESSGLPVSAITGGRIHNSFTVIDPSGNSVVVNSTHVVGAV